VSADPTRSPAAVSPGPRLHPARLDAAGLRFAVVVARFNHLIGVRLLEGCIDELVKRGAAADDVDVFWVPGAFEIPQAARVVAKTGRYAAVVTLGAVIRGGTPHFDYVCDGVTDGVREVMRDTGVPVAFGVLTTDDVEQALERAGGSDGNKGNDVAAAAVEMARLVASVPGAAAGSGSGERR
jgi:6,7-dimethyl-8-ribityllumazine synthase